MPTSLCARLSALGMVGLSIFVVWTPTLQSQQDPQTTEGYAITHSTTVQACSRCHTVDDQDRMSRISYLRKTPEGWQTSVRRMVALHDVNVSSEQARDIVRYLSNEQGLAPEELRPGLFEVERRLIEHDYEGDSAVEFTCIQCHSMGRVITQRRTQDEWALLMATHRGLYPLVDRQAFRGNACTGQPGCEENLEGQSNHPMDRAINHLGEVFPLLTPEWSAWSANKRPPQLEGEWVISGYEPGEGPIYGTLTIRATESGTDAFTSSSRYVYAESGLTVERSGQGLVYTGYQWRGRSNPGTADELREVMFIERDQQRMSGRWFSGAYDEIGPDVTLQRIGAAPIVTGVYPQALRRGETTEVTIYGGSLSDTRDGAGLDFGPGVSIGRIEQSETDELVVQLTIDADAALGARDFFAFESTLEDAIIVHDGIDRIVVTPESGMARVGGANFPKGYQTFEAIGYNNGPDNENGTDDDLKLGRVNVSWSLEEYTATFGDDDIDFVGSINSKGIFTPALDGVNTDRAGDRNNIGDVWVLATYLTQEGRELRARAHLLVTVPLYMRFEPWRPIGPANNQRLIG
ncbi:MAG TPA: quinohemoprotein amine dehydrogenase subunit alpha [Gemmatimonadetes bacterium]|nr:quinohemoprotein amine dehydrogenase subunit alpha [Gemmatimonadota bacterium]